MNRQRSVTGRETPRGFIHILLPVLLIMFAGCLTPPVSDKAEYDEVTVFDDIEEAEQIALYMEEEVLLNRFLLKRVFYDITLIRGAFGNDIEAVGSIKFKPPCKDGRIMIVFDAEIYDKVIAGKYEDWTELNNRYLPYDVKAVDRLRKVYLYFDGLLDFRALAERYSKLPHVESASCIGPIGDAANIYPRRTDTGIDYLFRDAWGACSTGCVNNEFYYFVCENDDAVFVGSWNPRERADPPEWWISARKCLPDGLKEQF